MLEIGKLTSKASKVLFLLLGLLLLLESCFTDISFDKYKQELRPGETEWPGPGW